MTAGRHHLRVVGPVPPGEKPRTSALFDWASDEYPPPPATVELSADDAHDAASILRHASGAFRPSFPGISKRAAELADLLEPGSDDRPPA